MEVREIEDLPTYPAEVLEPASPPPPRTPPKAASSIGLANAFWGAGIYAPPRMTPAQRRRATKLIAVVLLAPSFRLFWCACVSDS